MPTYEYGCTACGNEWEEVQRITAPPLEVCPKCGQSTAHRLISPGTNFILKGGGWYSDLYSSASSAGAKAARKEESSNSPSESTKTETPAAAPKADTSSSTTSTTTASTTATKAA